MGVRSENNEVQPNVGEASHVARVDRTDRLMRVKYSAGLNVNCLLEQRECTIHGRASLGMLFTLFLLLGKKIE